MKVTVTEGEPAVFMRGGNDPHHVTVLAVSRQHGRIAVQLDNGEVELATLDQLYRCVEPIESRALTMELRTIIVELAEASEHLTQSLFAIEFAEGEQNESLRKRINSMRESIRELALTLTCEAEDDSDFAERLAEKVRAAVLADPGDPARFTA